MKIIKLLNRLDDNKVISFISSNILLLLIIGIFFITPAIILGIDENIFTSQELAFMWFIPFYISLITIAIPFLAMFVFEYKIRIVLGKRYIKFNTWLGKILYKLSFLIIGIFVAHAIMMIIRFLMDAQNNYWILIIVTLSIRACFILKDFYLMGKSAIKVC